jgi:hypothetical protein
MPQSARRNPPLQPSCFPVVLPLIPSAAVVADRFGSPAGVLLRMATARLQVKVSISLGLRIAAVAINDQPASDAPGSLAIFRPPPQAVPLPVTPAGTAPRAGSMLYPRTPMNPTGPLRPMNGHSRQAVAVLARLAVRLGWPSPRRLFAGRGLPVGQPPPPISPRVPEV